MPRLSLISAVLACGALAACVSGPPPMEELTRARTLVDEASKQPGQRYAAVDLQRARDELAQAEDANRAGRYDSARASAESAAVDADVATARAAAGEARHAAREVADSNAALEGRSDERTGARASEDAQPREDTPAPVSPAPSPVPPTPPSDTSGTAPPPR